MEKVKLALLSILLIGVVNCATYECQILKDNPKISEELTPEAKAMILCLCSQSGHKSSNGKNALMCQKLVDATTEQFNVTRREKAWDKCRKEKFERNGPGTFDRCLGLLVPPK